MTRGPLNDVLGQRSKLEALRCLFADSRELTGREVARRTGLSHLAVHKALGELAQEGVVLKREAPPTYQFKLNPKHWLVADILLPMFRTEAAGPEKLEAMIKGNLPKGAASVVLFGSAVKGRPSPGGDIDVLILVDDPRRKEAIQAHFQGLAGKIYDSFHRPLSVLVVPLDEFLKQYRRGEKFAKEISYCGRVIAGKLLAEVLFEDGAKKNPR